jgi:hypothetical protein
MQFDKWAQLETLQLNNTVPLVFPLLPNSLKHLGMVGNGLMDLECSTSQESLGKLNLSNLESFSCNGCEAFTAGIISTIIKPSVLSNRLRGLDVGNRNLEDALGATKILCCESVESLSLNTLHSWKEDMLVQFATRHTNLEKLDLSGTRITGAGVKDIILALQGGGKGIKWLNLSDCELVSQDAVVWARSKGVDVRFTFPSRTMSAMERRRIL